MSATVGQGGCLPSPRFECTASDQCRLSGERDGACHEGYCTYADAGCDSGRRYHEHAPAELAGACVPEPSGTSTTAVGSSGVAGETSGGGDASSDATGETGNAAVCGNGEVEAGEVCDDGDTVDDGACNRRCQLAGEVLWQDTSSRAGRDLALGVAVLGDGTVVVAGELDGPADVDLSLRFFTADGVPGDEVVHDGPEAGDDSVGDLVTDPERLVVVGSNADRATLFVFDHAGAPLGNVREPSGLSSHWDAALFDDDGALYTTGHLATVDGDPDVWTRCHGPGLDEACGEAVFTGPAAGGAEGGEGLAWIGDTLLVVGQVNPGPGARADVFAQRLSATLRVLDTSVTERSALAGWTDAAASPTGRVFVSGFLDLGSGLRQIRAAAFGDRGPATTNFVVPREVEGTDFGRAVAVDSLGHVIVVGEIDLSADPDVRDYRGFVGKYDADFAEIWVRTVDIDASKVRAVAIDANDDIIVAGELEVEGEVDAFTVAFGA
ncbi:MAG: hypothetical protein AAF721_07420 [Myxococcota bacterium]